MYFRQKVMTIVTFIQQILSMILPDFVTRYLVQKKHEILKKEHSIWLTLRYAILQIAFFWAALSLAITVYFVVYYLTIPYVHQYSKVSFIKTSSLYQARIFNPDGEYPICHEKIYQIDQQIVKQKDDLPQSICINPLQKNILDFKFQRETYKISLKFIIPKITTNYEVGTFPVVAEFISDNNDILFSHALGIINDESPRYSVGALMNLMKSGLGLTGNEMMVDVLITEDFQNDLFKVSVINLEVPTIQPIFKYCFIEIEAKLKGLRYFMYYWFWTAAFLAVFTLTISFFLVFNLLMVAIVTSHKIVFKIKSKFRGYLRFLTQKLD